MENYFFDFDGTLCESRDIYVASVQKTFEEHGVKVPTRAEVYGAMGIPINVSIARWARAGHRPELANRLFEEAMAEYNKLEDGMVKVFPGISKLLTELLLAGKKLYVCSSKTHAELAHNLEMLHMTSFFTDFVGADEVVNHKPAPDEIELLAKRYDLDLADSIMLGDAKYDIKMGKNAGCQTCACTWGAFDLAALAAEKPDFTASYPTDSLSF